jgi:hypothetical protein
MEYHGRYNHVANGRTVEELDDGLLSWLTESYLGSPT